MENKKKPPFYITTPIYYVNGEPHAGSCYTSLICDVIARFKELDGYDVKFLTGTDEHGQKIGQAAEKAGKLPKDFVDEVSERFVDLIKLMNFQPSTFDYLGKYKDNDFSFMRTTLPKHEAVVRNVWRRLVKNGWIYKGAYKGWYCVSDEAYYTEDDLIKDENGEWKTSIGKSVEWREEESYFFRLSEFQDILLALYKYYPSFTSTELVSPEEKRNENIAFVSGLTIKEWKEGRAPRKNHLKDLSVSRNNFEWGVRIPCDLEGKELLDKNHEWKEGLEPHEKHVIYVWLDALFNYISALGAFIEGKDEEYKKYWRTNKKPFMSSGWVDDPDSHTLEKQNDGPTVVHVVGKDIHRFHAVYWPAFLIACEYPRGKIEEIKEGSSEVKINEATKLKQKNDFKFIEQILDKTILPDQLFVHNFWMCEGRKMSKSFGNVVIPKKEIKWLKTEYNLSQETAVDYFRYFLSTEMPYGSDGDYSRKKLIERINTELANNIGNLTQRVLSFIHKNCDAKIPNYEKNSDCEELLKKVDELIENKDLISKYRFAEYVLLLKNIADNANEFIEQQKPWELKKADPKQLSNVLYTLSETIRKIAILLMPFCPYSAKKMLQALGISIKDIDKVNFDSLNKQLKPGVSIEKPMGIFPRLIKK